MEHSKHHHRKKDQVTEKEDKYLLGALGAFLFSLIGAGIYFLLNAIGLIESLAGFICVYCAIIGYSVFAKKESKKGVIISLIIAAAVITVSWYFAFCLTTVEQINLQASQLPVNFRYTISLADFIPKSFKVLTEQPEMFLSLILALVFGALGYFSYANGLFYTGKPKSDDSRSGHRHSHGHHRSGEHHRHHHGDGHEHREHRHHSHSEHHSHHSDSEE